MGNKKVHPKYTIKIKRLSKTKTVTIFRRNYLNLDNFNWIDNCWVFEEKFTHYGKKCRFKLTVHLKNLAGIFNVDTKELKVRGNWESCNIFIRFPEMDTPIDIHGRVKCIEYDLACTGKSLAYDDGKRIISSKPKESHSGRTRKRKGMKVTGETLRQPYSNRKTQYSTTSWSVSHPYGGGSYSPK